MIVRKGFKQNTNEPRKFVVPDSLYEAKIFNHTYMRGHFSGKEERWQYSYNEGTSTIGRTTSVFRFRHDQEDTSLITLVNEVFKSVIETLSSENRLPKETHKEIPINFKPPYN